MQYFCFNKDENVHIIAVRWDFWGYRERDIYIEGERERKKERGRKILWKLWYSVRDPYNYIITISSITLCITKKKDEKA